MIVTDLGLVEYIKNYLKESLIESNQMIVGMLIRDILYNQSGLVLVKVYFEVG